MGAPPGQQPANMSTLAPARARCIRNQPGQPIPGAIYGSNLADESNIEPARPKRCPDPPLGATGSTHKCYPTPLRYIAGHDVGSGVVPALVGLGGTGERLIAGISWRLSGRRRTGCGGFASPGSAGSPARFALRAGICVLFYLLLTQG